MGPTQSWPSRKTQRRDCMNGPLSQRQNGDQGSKYRESKPYRPMAGLACNILRIVLIKVIDGYTWIQHKYLPFFWPSNFDLG